MKKVPKHLAAKARKCVFCDAPGLSRTHIWPEWLNNLLGRHPCRTLRWEKTNYSIGKPAKLFGHQVKQGSIFSQKPLLACVRCNTGWMKSFEDEMNKFAIPIFTASEIVAINQSQIKVLATWVSLVSVLAEFMDQSGLSVSITKEDRQFIKNNLRPPPDWSIFISSINGEKWRQHYQHTACHVGQFRSREHFEANNRSGLTANTQVTSFGAGRLFVQVFTCPSAKLVTSYRVEAAHSGLSQI